MRHALDDAAAGSGIGRDADGGVQTRIVEVVRSCARSGGLKNLYHCIAPAVVPRVRGARMEWHNTHAHWALSFFNYRNLAAGRTARVHLYVHQPAHGTRTLHLPAGVRVAATEHHLHRLLWTHTRLG